MKRKLCKELAYLVIARLSCIQNNNLEWLETHENRIKSLVEEHFPSGSGFNNGTQIDLEKSKPELLVFDTGYHHMDEYGTYTNWTSHEVKASPSFAYGVILQISGQNKNNIKDHIYQAFLNVLKTEIEIPQTNEEAY